jgi:hypothetical protein
MRDVEELDRNEKELNRKLQPDHEGVKTLRAIMSQTDVARKQKAMGHKSRPVLGFGGLGDLSEFKGSMDYIKNQEKLRRKKAIAFKIVSSWSRK